MLEQGNAATRGLLNRVLQARSDSTGVAPQTPQTTDTLTKRISTLDHGLESPAVAFQIIASELPVERGGLFVADTRAARYVPCASAQWQPTAEDAVDAGRARSILQSKPVFELPGRELPFSPALCRPDETVLVRRFDFESEPVGLLAIVGPTPRTRELIDSVAQSMAVLLHASNDRFASIRPARLSTLHDVSAAGATRVYSVSCREILRCIRTETPCLNPFWISEFLLRLLASLFEPLGIVDRNAQCGIRLLTTQDIDPEILIHQVSIVLGRYLRSTHCPLNPVFEPPG